MAKKSNNIDIEFFGKNLRKEREAKTLSMQQLANIADIEKSQIARIEIGKSDPKLSTMLTIAKALDLDLKELLKSE